MNKMSAISVNKNSFSPIDLCNLHLFDKKLLQKPKKFYFIIFLPEHRRAVVASLTGSYFLTLAKNGISDFRLHESIIELQIHVYMGKFLNSL